MRQDEKGFKGWKKIRIKLTSSYSGNYLGLTYFAVEKVDSETTSKMEESSTSLIKGATLDIPLLSDDDDVKDENPQEKFEQARKMAHTKLSASPSLDIKPNLPSAKLSVSSTEVKKRTLPSGITAKPTKSSSQTNDIDDSSEKTDTSKKRTRKKEESKKKPIKFKSIAGLDESDKSDSEKDQKKADKKKPTTRKKTTTRKKKYSSDPSNTDDEDKMIDDASDADENGNLAGFVVSNKTTIKDKRNLKDGPVTSKENVLVGCVIAISGIQNPERATIREKALEMGASYRPNVTSDTTHLVAAFVSDKGREAQKQGSKIVTKEWVYDCYSKLRRMNEKKYSLKKDDSLSDDEEAEASLGSDIDFELSEDSSEKDMEAEDGEYVPKRKKKKVSRKPEQKPEKKNESKPKNDKKPEKVVHDSSKDNSQTDVSSKNVTTSASAALPNDKPPTTSSPSITNEKSEAPPTQATTATSLSPPTTTLVNKCDLSSSEEQELLRFKKFFDDSPNMKKSFADFIREDIFGAAISCTREGDIMAFFEQWSLNTPSPKFLRSIAKLAMDDDETNKEELINSIDHLKNKMLQYINLNLSNKPIVADVDLEGPQAALPSFFEGCIVYFDPAVKNQRELRRYIIAYGGEIADDFSERRDDITHVIVNPDYDGNILYNDKRIVDWKWVQHSHRRQRKLNEEAYAVGD
nr:unnamed protein product [Naegleria fowleri]